MNIIAIIYIVLILLSLLIKRSKVITIVLLLFLWLLFGWSSDNADYANYVLKYNYIDQLASGLEPLFVIIVKIFKHLGLDYRSFLIIFSAMYFIFMYFFAKKFTKNTLFVFALYSIFPFMLDVVQIRQTMAFPLIWLGIYFYLKGQSKSSYFYSCLFIVLASLIHGASLYFLLLFFMDKIRIKYKEIIILAFVPISFLIVPLIGTLFIRISLLLGINGRLQQYSTFTSSAYNLDPRKVILILLLFIFYLIGYFVIRSLNKKLGLLSNIELERFGNLILVSFFTLPLSGFMPDIYRILTGISFINYLYWAKFFDETRPINFITSREFSLRTFTIIFSLVGIFLLVLSSTNYNYVFLPLFQNNEIINYIFS